jgi:Gpi18-like mannosyltransferase
MRNTVFGREFVLFALGVIIAILARVSLFAYMSKDLKDYVLPWFSHLSGKGFVDAFGMPFANYNPPYLYLLWLVARLGFEPVLSIKILGLLFDFLCALLGALVARSFGVASLASFLAILFIPTVALNGAMWGQADAVYTAFMIAAVLSIMEEKPLLSFLFWGCSFAVKAQAAFVLPAYFILWVIRVIDLRTAVKGAFIAVAVFLIALLPALLAGQPVADLFSTYPAQFNTYKSLSMHAPNVWQWFKRDGFVLFRPAGMCFTAGMVILWAMFSVDRRYHDKKVSILTAFTLSALLVPFFAPKMHDRYFFMADVLTVVLALVVRRTWWIALCVNLASLFAYMDSVLGVRPCKLSIVAFLNLAALIGLTHLWRDCQTRSD